MIQVELPYHVRLQAGLTNPVLLDVTSPVTYGRVIDAIESQFPSTVGMLRAHGQSRRRDLIRIFACQDDWSNADPDEELPEPIRDGREPLLIIGAIAGG